MTVAATLARWLCLFVFRGATSSSCTGLPPDMKPGQVAFRTFTAHDHTGSYERHYSVHIPIGYTGFDRTPALFYFHGWAEEWPCTSCKFHEAGNRHGFITIEPAGMQDGQPGWRSWNVLSGGRTDICTSEMTEPKNYSSCAALNSTGPCNCYTCHDDVQFVAGLAEVLSDELCIDDDNVFGTGASNGAMFLYSLVPALADLGLRPRFKAIIPFYGAGFEHMEGIQHPVAGTAVFHHHGTLDVTIPPHGGESYDHWLYVPVERTLVQYALGNGCSDQREVVKTPWDNNDMLLGCHGFKGCGGRPVVRCNYNASHGFWEPYQEEMLWWQISHLILPSDASVVV